MNEFYGGIQTAALPHFNTIENNPRLAVSSGRCGISFCKLCQKDDYLLPIVESDPFLEFYKINAVCSACLFDLSLEKLREARREWKIKRGHIPELTFGHCTNHGFGKAGLVYIVPAQRHYKIGATTRSLSKRMYACGCTQEDFIHAIGTHKPYGLEGFIHRVFAGKRVLIKGHQEIFDLSPDDIRWLKNMKTADGQPVTHYYSLDQIPRKLR